MEPLFEESAPGLLERFDPKHAIKSEQREMLGDGMACNFVIKQIYMYLQYELYMTKIMVYHI